MDALMPHARWARRPHAVCATCQMQHVHTASTQRTPSDAAQGWLRSRRASSSQWPQPGEASREPNVPDYPILVKTDLCEIKVCFKLYIKNRYEKRFSSSRVKEKRYPICGAAFYANSPWNWGGRRNYAKGCEKISIFWCINGSQNIVQLSTCCH